MTGFRRGQQALIALLALVASVAPAHAQTLGG